MNSALRIPSSALKGWLPDLDLNQDKQIQSLLCYRYTIGQSGARNNLESLSGQSSRQSGTGFQPVSGPILLISNQRQAGSLSHD